MKTLEEKIRLYIAFWGGLIMIHVVETWYIQVCWVVFYIVILIKILKFSLLDLRSEKLLSPRKTLN